MNKWPLQSECDSFYGDPRGQAGMPSKEWMRVNLVRIPVFFRMTYDTKPIQVITIHKKCADSLTAVLAEIWDKAGKEQRIIDSWGMGIFGGSFSYRLMRGGNRLSMHAYGCAVDFDPERNGLGDHNPHFRLVPQVLNAFAKEGWVWGGTWSRPDGMHFQAARVG